MGIGKLEDLPVIVAQVGMVFQEVFDAVQYASLEVGGEAIRIVLRWMRQGIPGHKVMAVFEERN